MFTKEIALNAHWDEGSLNIVFTYNANLRHPGNPKSESVRCASKLTRRHYIIPIQSNVWSDLTTIYGTERLCWDGGVCVSVRCDRSSGLFESAINLWMKILRPSAPHLYHSDGDLMACYAYVCLRRWRGLCAAGRVWERATHRTHVHIQRLMRGLRRLMRMCCASQVYTELCARGAAAIAAYIRVLHMWNAARSCGVCMSVRARLQVNEDIISPHYVYTRIYTHLLLILVRMLYISICIYIYIFQISFKINKFHAIVQRNPHDPLM